MIQLDLVGTAMLSVAWLALAKLPVSPELAPLIVVFIALVQHRASRRRSLQKRINALWPSANRTA